MMPRVRVDSRITPTALVVSEISSIWLVDGNTSLMRPTMPSAVITGMSVFRPLLDPLSR